MKTDDLITRLVDDLPHSPAVPAAGRKGFAILALSVIGTTIALSAALYGLRPSGPSGGGLGMLAWLAAAITAVMLTIRMRVPEPAPMLISRAPVLGLTLLLLVVAALTHAEGKALVEPSHLLHCLKTIGLLAVIPFLGVSLLIRRGAPSSPLAAGGLAGLFAGSVGALAYSLSCPIGDPVSAFAAHAMTVVIITGIGAVIGWRLFAW